LAENALELAVHRTNTKAFIDADPRSIVLVRSVPVSNGSGGTIPGPATPQPAQTMRLMPVDTAVTTERRLADGSVAVPSWTLLGEYTANMKRGDTLTLPDGTTGEIAYVHEKRTYQVKGEVATRGAR
jgi:hypothetical protein